MIFHERRLQYMEREQLESWERTRPGESILDLGRLAYKYMVKNTVIVGERVRDSLLITCKLTGFVQIRLSLFLCDK